MKKKQFACHSCYKVTTTTNERIFDMRLCFSCRNFREYDKIVGEMIPK